MKRPAYENARAHIEQRRLGWGSLSDNISVIRNDWDDDDFEFAAGLRFGQFGTRWEECRIINAVVREEWAWRTFYSRRWD